MRSAVSILAAMAACLPTLAVGQQSAPAGSDPRKTAYLFSVKCYVANNTAATDRRYGNSTATVARFRDQADRAQKYAVQLGHALGASDALIREDFESYTVMLNGVFSRDANAFPQLHADCVKIGLM